MGCPNFFRSSWRVSSDGDGLSTIADQPFQILLELVQEHKLDPWDVDIEKLAEVFMQRLREKFDLRVSGRALHSASAFLRVKSDCALNGHKGAPTPEELDLSFIDLPELGQISILQRAVQKITLAELMDALGGALKDIPPPKPHQSKRLEKVVRRLSEYHVNIEELLKELYQRIENFFSSTGRAPFSELIVERTRLAVVRTFLLLLFLCALGKVLLSQAEPFGEIFVFPAGAE